MDLKSKGSEMILKTFAVSYRIYDTPEQLSYSSDSDIRTLVQAQTYHQVQSMIEGQYQGRAHIWSIVEKY
jgi:hypothetical protein